jgi:predicted membrane protein
MIALIEGNMEGLGLLIAVILFLAFGVPIILAIIGFVLFAKKKKKPAKVLFIIATVYLIISLGICGSMML